MIIKEFFETGIWKLIWKSAKSASALAAGSTLFPFETVSGIRDSFTWLNA
jgi:hypothetical protein